MCSCSSIQIEGNVKSLKKNDIQTILSLTEKAIPAGSHVYCIVIFSPDMVQVAVGKSPNDNEGDVITFSRKNYRWVNMGIQHISPEFLESLRQL
jgi:hypothetical protein